MSELIASSLLLNQELTEFRPFESAPVSLGGLSKATDVDHVAESTSTYCSLNRMAALPPLSQSRKVKDEEAKNAFIRMSEGDFLARWVVIDDRALFLEAGILNEQGGYVPVLETRFRKVANSVCHNPPKTLSGLGEAIPEKALWRLTKRVLHIFMRSAGICLPWNMVMGICSYLLIEYKAKRPSEALDIVMVAADIAINKGLTGDEELRWALVMTCVSLGALGRFQDAGRVNLERVETTTEETEWCSGYKLSINYFQNARDFDMTEVAIVKALHSNWKHQGSKWEPSLIADCLNLYSEWWELNPDEEEAFELLQVFMVMSNLLAIMGYRSSQQHPAFFNNSLLVKRKFREKNQAKRALETAVQRPDTKYFRANITVCCNPQFLKSLQSQLLESRTAKYNRTPTQVNDVKTHGETLNDLAGKKFVFCSNPNCRARMNKVPGEYKRCPCDRAFYCQKSCQVIHWKEYDHKSECSHYATLKKNKKELEKAADTEYEQVD